MLNSSTARFKDLVTQRSFVETNFIFKILVLHSISLLGYKRLSRIKSFQQFLVRSCQNELMRSNNFVVKVAGKKCSEVEALPKNYYGCEQILQILSRGPQA